MRRLIVFTNTFPFGKGETFFEAELLYLSRVFAKVILVPLAASGKEITRALPENTQILGPVFNFGLEKKLRLFIQGTFNLSPCMFATRELFRKKVFLKSQWLRNWLSFTCITRAILASGTFKKLLNEIQIHDVCYFYWADNLANIVPFLRKKVNNRCFVRFHGTDLYEERKGGWLPFRNNLIRNVDFCLFVSEHGKRYLSEKYPGVSSKAILSRLGVRDFGIAKAGSGEVLNIISCSALISLKRVELIAKSLKLLKIPVNWVHFGDGPDFNSLQQLIRALPDNITATLAGHVQTHELIEYYRTHPVDLFIHVSASEGLPVAIMEALSMGIPVIATDVGGVSEVITPESGYLLSSSPLPEEISEKIMHFYHRTDRGLMREKSRYVWSTRCNAEKNYSDLCQILLLQ